jgi:FKBP-type peptidyl-prolyl cis-trans isomerase SlyD
VKTFYVTRIGEETLTIDGNHPLAGKSLKVQVQIREVRDPTADEIAEDGAAGGLPGPSIH